MEALRGIETTLDDVLVKKAPFQLPAGLKKFLIDYAWIFALIGTVLGGLSLIALLGVLGFVSVAATAVGAGGYMLFAWLAFIALAIQVILTAMAISPLKAKLKRGWDLLFAAQVIGIVFQVFNVLQYRNGAANVASIIWTLFWVVVGLYILFQVRSGFKKA